MNTTNTNTGTTMTIEQLKAQMKAKAKQAQAQATQNLLQSEGFQQAMLNQLQKELTTEKLKSIEAQLRLVPTTYPEFGKGDKASELRTWKDKYLFNLGSDITIINNIIQGMQYCSQLHKQVMKGILPLTDSFIESLSAAFGRQAYFSLSTGYSESIPMDYIKVRELLMLLQAELNVTFDLSLFTENNVNLQWQIAENNADAARIKYETAIANTSAHFITV